VLSKVSCVTLAFGSVHNKSKSEVKLSHYCHAGNKGERAYSSCLFFTSAVVVGGHFHTLAVLFPPGKGPVITIG
jgi:hypothetical protein